MDKNIVQRPVFSLMLINGYEGVLSVGGTAAPAVELVLSETRHDLDKIGSSSGATKKSFQGGVELVKRSEDDKKHIPVDNKDGPVDSDWRRNWAWSKTQGAEGWWQILMQSVWVDGMNVLKNQAVVLDVSEMTQC